MKNSSISIRPILDCCFWQIHFSISMANTEQLYKKINSFHYLMVHFATSSSKRAHWNAVLHKIKYSTSSTMLETNCLEGHFSSLLPGPTIKIGDWHQGQNEDDAGDRTPHPCSPHNLATITESSFTSSCVLPLPVPSTNVCSLEDRPHGVRVALPCVGREPELPGRLHPSPQPHQRQSLSISLNTWFKSWKAQLSYLR